MTKFRQVTRDGLFIGLILLFAKLGIGQHDEPKLRYTRANIVNVMGFEDQGVGGLPLGWSGGPPGTVGMDSTIVHGGRWAAKLARTDRSVGNLSTLALSIPSDFQGKEIELRGFLRTANINGTAGLWLREDGKNGPLHLNNMASEHLAGTNDWKQFEITLSVDPASSSLSLGVYLTGAGALWADDLELLVDEAPIADATKRTELAHVPPIASGVRIEQLSKLQTDNLVRLGRVWGFLKYHHPFVTAGRPNWDDALLQMIPRVLNAQTVSSANKMLSDWISQLGRVDTCKICVSLKTEGLALKPDVDWIRDKLYLGDTLSEQLQSIYRNRIFDQQYYVELPGKGSNLPRNVLFSNEPSYDDIKFPDSGYQLLALFRFWNIVEYWSPNRDITARSWNLVLTNSVPRIALAGSRDEFLKELDLVIASMNDGHANLVGGEQILPPVGPCRLPVDLELIEDKAVISGFTNSNLAASGGLRIGDTITTIDGVSVSQIIDRSRRFYSASNEVARSLLLGRNLTRGNCKDTDLEVERNNHHISLRTMRLSPAAAGVPRFSHDLRGATFRLISPDVAYLKISSIHGSDLKEYIERASQAHGLIIDLRGYPSEFVAFSLGSLLVSQPTAFSYFTAPDLSNPGAFYNYPPNILNPSQPHFSRKVVLLVDEVTLSQAEYTAMALASAPDAVVVGSSTAGADGNVSAIPLPGGLRTQISGLGVYYPSGKSTQQVGIRVDVPVKITTAGLTGGRDEILEAGIHEIVPEMPRSEVIKLSNYALGSLERTQ